MAASSLFSGCITTPTMEVPGDIAASSDEITATERSSWSGSLANETFTLGQYKVTKVNRDWDSNQSNTVSIAKLDINSGTIETGYDYTFETPSGEYYGRCDVKIESDSLASSGFSIEERSSSFNCACKTGNGTVGKTALKATNKGSFAGSLEADGENYTVKALQQHGETSGYRIDSINKNSTPSGAVEVYKPGRIWLDKDLNEKQKDILACQFVGLMLYLAPEPEVDIF
ncbi:MAG: hypothetical protein HRU20_11205 [Pseudomonadales bacterium]|nr:hypothetical protein [Pseudomonadales bacterium]